MRNHSFFIPALFLAAVIHINAYAAPLAFSPEADDKACAAKGFVAGAMADPVTEQYYLCRADLARSHMTHSSGLLGKLRLSQVHLNHQLSVIAKEFDAKAKTAQDEAARASVGLFKAWDDAQSETAKQFDEYDDKTCVKAGFSPISWANPDTEQYYVCRARLIEERAPTPPVIAKKRTRPISRAALYFYRKAQEAQYAFRIIDEQTHHACLEKGGIPGELDDPKTKLYYECRAKLAEAQMGQKIARLFYQRAQDAADASLGAGLCEEYGIKRDSPNYRQCRGNIPVYKKCLHSIDGKVENTLSNDKTLCRKETAVHCMQQKSLLQEQYRQSFKSECASILKPALL